MTLDQLESHFAHRKLHPGAVIVLSAPHARELIDAARRAGFPILGLDGFHVREGSIQPDLTHSIDYSTSEAGNWSTALQFLNDHESAVTGFEVVLGEASAGAA